MSLANHNSVRTDLAAFQRPARMGAASIEYINVSADLSGTHKPTANLAYPDLLVDEIGFAHQTVPSHREDFGGPHTLRISRRGGDAATVS